MSQNNNIPNPPPMPGQDDQQGQHGIPGQHAEAQAALRRITARIPVFWPEKPELWFRQLEAQFALSEITREATKYRWVVANL